MTERRIEDIFTALDEQTATAPGTEAAALIVPSLAATPTSVFDQHKLPARRIEELLEAHPLCRPDPQVHALAISRPRQHLPSARKRHDHATWGVLTPPATRNDQIEGRSPILERQFP